MKNCEAVGLFLFFNNKEFITLWFKSTYDVVLNAMREKNIVYVHTPQLLNKGRIYWLSILTKREKACTTNCLNDYEMLNQLQWRIRAFDKGGGRGGGHPHHPEIRGAPVLVWS